MTIRSRGQSLAYSIALDLGVAIVSDAKAAQPAFRVEKELCRKYGASRAIVREAVRMLASKGLLDARRSHGTRVRPERDWNLFDPDVLEWMGRRRFSPTLSSEFDEVRQAVEPAAAAIAARALSEAARAEILAALARIRTAAWDQQDQADSLTAFHAAVLGATCNRFYAQFADFIATAIRFKIRNAAADGRNTRPSPANYKKIADAIFAGRPNAAAQAMRNVLQEGVVVVQAAADG